MTTATGKVTSLLLKLDFDLIQYEWVESENKWVKFFDSDPEPPSDLPAGQFDGQIIDVEQ